MPRWLIGVQKASRSRGKAPYSTILSAGWHSRMLQPVRPAPLSPAAATEPAFLAEGRTGNVKLGIKDGRVMGLRIEEIITVKSARKPDEVNRATRGLLDGIRGLALVDT